MFHQIEGLVCRREVSFADLKGVLDDFLRNFFERDLAGALQAIVFSLHDLRRSGYRVRMCSGKGCRVCKQTGWLEVLGCGMVHPKVFEHVGIDNEK